MQSRMDNPVTLATLGTQDIVQRHKKQQLNQNKTEKMSNTDP